jgi:tryptophan 2-monooxygenase
MLGSYHAKLSPAQSVTNDWLPDFPNSPDLRFDYFKLLNDACVAQAGIGRAGPNNKVAIIGAGSAGLTAARELYRSGFQVTIYEASDRISGRLYTETPNYSATSMEFGAMRMPFFDGGTTSSSAAASTNCLLSYYLNRDQSYSGSPNPTYANLSEFPNPGQADGNTGIYINNGLGPNDTYTSPTLIPWPKGQDPQNPDLVDVQTKVNNFIDLINQHVPAAFATDDSTWPVLWEQIANNYDKMSFGDMVRTQAVTTYQNDGWFGGFGMDDYEASLLYTIGTGDGSWGAFYNIGALWWMRCSLFGYSSNLQTVSGLNNSYALPYFNDSVNDSGGSPLHAPIYAGIQSLSEQMFYLPPPGSNDSLCSSMQKNSGVRLFTSSPVNLISKQNDGSITVNVKDHTLPEPYDFVIVTAPIWAAQLSIKFDNFTTSQLPSSVYTAMDEQHLIASCKVFFPLTTAYWNLNPQPIPQILVTDTAVQDAYGVKWNDASGTGQAALLGSYTWEDDARKLLASSDADLTELVKTKLDEITITTCNGAKVSSYIDNSQSPEIIHWVLQPSYRGCGKLYRSRDWEKCYDLLTYNQQYSAISGLHFAGESYGVEGGWTEPALRTAIDAVIHVINNSGGSFNNNNGNNFSFGTYPQYDMSISPDETYPQTSGN